MFPWDERRVNMDTRLSKLQKSSFQPRRNNRKAWKCRRISIFHDSLPISIPELLWGISWMAECGLQLRVPFFPTLVKYAAEKVEEGGTIAHLEVGTVPQQVPKAWIVTTVTLNSGDASPLARVEYCWVLLRVRGPQALSTALFYIILPGSGLD